MALEGTFDTFSITDVLGLMARTAQSGRLDIVVDDRASSVWFTAGTVVGASTNGEARMPADVVFDSWRHAAGTFSLRTDADGDVEAASTAATASTSPQEVNDLVRRVDHMAAEWQSLIAVVPSTACRLHLRADPARPHIVLDGERWRLVLALATTNTVGGLATALGCDEVSVRRLVVDAVDAGIVTLEVPVRLNERNPDAPVDPFAGLSPAAARAIMAVAGGDLARPTTPPTATPAPAPAPASTPQRSEAVGLLS